MDDRTFVVASDWIHATSAHRGVIRDPALMRGFSLSMENLDDREITLLGRWPDDAWLHVTTHFKDGTAGDFFYEYSTFRWMQDHWEKQELVKEGESRLVGVSAWGEGGALIATSHGKEIRFQLSSGEPPPFQPTKTPWADRTTNTDTKSFPPKSPRKDLDRECISEVYTRHDVADARQLLTLPSGHVFLAGSSCRDREQAWLIERFDSNGSLGIDRLPKTRRGFSPVQLAGVEPGEIYMAVYPRTLQRFDGKRWHIDSPPGKEPIYDLDVSAEGTLWLLLADGALHRRSRGGGWEQFPLPKTYATSERGKAMRVKDMSVPSDDRVWVLDQYGEAYTMGAVEEVIKLPARWSAEVAPQMTPQPPEPRCPL